MLRYRAILFTPAPAQGQPPLIRPVEVHGNSLPGLVSWARKVLAKQPLPPKDHNPSEVQIYETVERSVMVIKHEEKQEQEIVK